MLLKLLENLKPGTLCLLSATPLSGRSIFAQQLFYESLHSGYSSIYVTTNNFTSDIIKELRERAWDVEKFKGYIFVDTYSAQASPGIEDTDRIKYIASVADLAKLSNTIISSLGKFSTSAKRQLLVFDSLDALLMHVSPQSVYRFFYYLRAKVKSFDAASLLIIDRELHEPKTIKMLSQLADVLINVNDERKELALTFADSSQKILKYKIGKKGFEL